MKYISLFTPATTLKIIWLWPPYLSSGISVKTVNSDVTEVVVQKKTNFWNQNYFGTHFGGSLFAMCDPFYVFILMQHLGKDHRVWDIGSEIEFVKATSKPVFAKFSISHEQVEKLKAEALLSFKIEPEFSTQIEDAEGNVIAKIKKKIYIRRKDAKTRFANQKKIES